MNKLEELRKEKLKEIEKNLVAIGFLKCKKCNCWIVKEAILENGCQRCQWDK